MTVAEDWQLACSEFFIEEIWTGAFASGFGEVGDGRSFSFRVEQQSLVVDIYRPQLQCPVPHDEDVVATASRKMFDIDLADERSLTAAVRDVVADLTR
ncbi:hypothetical protein [Mycolicibacter sinensis]|jgi:hypothetical protein|uniref:Uncharacterized protein n=1 Tax=Mycolicibacter sinensis (strain JDM601) TaxID=875328 RepID=A0A1A2E8A3_MYCSD|nr:hypothetical protein [Mycolicibacter sinensis]MDD7815123.1 hypothetical protein [Mycobacterium sp. CSUR Q5927]OBG01352.1 hypothetical protein A5772_09825 [Mycolicibacter sinensis]OBG03720.1 hypothetical protein A5771_13070 [Mycolicibacter sinensis]OBK89906.1 hypothetical protein A5648_18830 [Mycolicibacter sinensis]